MAALAKVKVRKWAIADVREPAAPDVWLWWRAAVARVNDTPLFGTMDWSQIAPDFKVDGSLRDIYILNTSLADWANVWATLLAGPHSLSFSVDGELTTAPLDVREAFRLRRDHAVCASYALGRQRLNCHFFIEDEVEFDLDPRDVGGPVEADRLAQFLAALGRATSKEVRLTPENEPDAVIARYEPTTGQVVWVPAKG